MKNKVWLVYVLAGMLFGIPHVEAQAAVDVQIGTRIAIGSGKGNHQYHHHHHHRRYVESRRFREERRRHHDREYHRHHPRRGSSITIKL